MPVKNNKVTYALIFLLMLLFCFAKLADSVRPFGLSLFLGLLFAGFNTAIIAPLYIVCSLIAAPSLNTAVEIAVTTAVVIAAALVQYKLRKKIPPVFFGVLAVLSQVGYLYICIVNKSDVINTAASIVLGVALSYVCGHAAQSFGKLNNTVKLMHNEIISFTVMIIISALGVSCIPVAGMSLSRALLSFISLLSVFALGAPAGIAVSIAYGAGIALMSANAGYIGIAGCLALAAIMFYKYNKILAAAGVVLVDLALGLYFNLDNTLLDMVWTASGALLFLLLPEKLYAKLDGMVNGERAASVDVDVAKRQRKSLSEKLSKISRAYREIDTIFSAMGGKAEKNIALTEAIADAVPRKVCSDCKNAQHCYVAEREETQAAINAAANHAISKGRASITSIPQVLASRCVRADEIINAVNISISDYNLKSKLLSVKQEERDLLGTQLSGVAEVMEKLSSEVKQGISVDEKQEALIEQEMLALSIRPVRVRVLNLAGGIKNITVSVKPETGTDSEKLLSELSRITKTKLVVVSKTIAETGETEISFETAPKYDLSFGVSNTSKWGTIKSGDTHTLLKISKNIVLMALCDGMGSGISAENFSASTIGLIENFYKAGFDSPTILTLVNKLLSLKNDEVFSALDVCIINLAAGTADFIKLGGTYGLIRTSDGAEVVAAGALPIGVLETVKPVISTKTLSDGDMVLLSSDGITDIFNSAENYAGFVSGLTSLNPAVIAEQILDFATRSDSYMPHDDMTIMAARLVLHK